jgi:hypothetical protein
LPLEADKRRREYFDEGAGKNEKRCDCEEPLSLRHVERVCHQPGRKGQRRRPHGGHYELRPDSERGDAGDRLALRSYVTLRDGFRDRDHKALGEDDGRP